MAPENPDTRPRMAEKSKEDRFVVEETVGMQATREGKGKTVEAIETPSKHMPDHRSFMYNIDPANYDECLELPVLLETSLPRRVEEEGNQNDDNCLHEGEQAVMQDIDQLERESAIDRYLSGPATASKRQPQAQEKSGSSRSKRHIVRSGPKAVDGDAKLTQM